MISVWNIVKTISDIIAITSSKKPESKSSEKASVMPPKSTKNTISPINFVALLFLSTLNMR